MMDSDVRVCTEGAPHACRSQIPVSDSDQVLTSNSSDTNQTSVGACLLRPQHFHAHKVPLQLPHCQLKMDVRVCTPSQGAPPPARRFFISQPYSSSLTLLILLAIGSRTAAADADYPSVMWVDAVGGTDDDPCGSGGPESPCKSIQFALRLFPSKASMTSNATIHVAAGNYTVPSSGGGIDFEGRPVMIVGEKGKTVVDCDGARNDTTVSVEA